MQSSEDLHSLGEEQQHGLYIDSTGGGTGAASLIAVDEYDDVTLTTRTHLMRPCGAGGVPGQPVSEDRTSSCLGIPANSWVPFLKLSR